MRCKVCGANLPVESLFCYACGYRFDKKNNKKKNPSKKAGITYGNVSNASTIYGEKNLMLLEDMVLLLKEQITYMIKLQATMHSL